MAGSWDSQNKALHHPLCVWRKYFRKYIYMAHRYMAARVQGYNSDSRGYGGQVGMVFVLACVLARARVHTCVCVCVSARARARVCVRS